VEDARLGVDHSQLMRGCARDELLVFMKKKKKIELLRAILSTT
jgi:hypothetical protein